MRASAFFVFLSLVRPWAIAAEDARDSLVRVRAVKARVGLRPLPGPQLQWVTGTGFCVEPPGAPCRHFLTNYHVAALAGRRVKVEGVAAKASWATGPKDEGASPVRIGGDGGPVKRYDPGKDVALLITEKPLGEKFRGARFSERAPVVGQPVLLYSHRGRKVESVRGVLRSVDIPLRFNGSDRLLRGTLVADVAVPPGYSGGLMTDLDGRVLGVIAFLGKTGATPETMTDATIALSVPAVAEIVRGLDPSFAQAVFAGVDWSPPREEEEALPLFVAPETEPSLEDGAEEVSALKTRVELLAGQMTNLIARQCYWSLESARKICHEVAIQDGDEVLKGKDGSTRAAFPQQKKGIWMSGGWRDALEGLLDLPLEYAGQTKDGDRVFRFSGEKLCSYSEYGSSATWSGDVDCSGYVVADAEMNLKTYAEDSRPPGEVACRDLSTVTQFGEVNLKDGSRLVLPRSARMSARWRRGPPSESSFTWSDYARFRARAQMCLGDGCGSSSARPPGPGG